MVHRRFQADSQRAHGSIEGLHEMRTTLMDVTVGTFQVRQDIRAKSDDSYEDRDEDRPDPCDCWYLKNVIEA